ncbi:hypothetical protein GCM10027294_08530 [Marinactinospora endophytica]
MDRSSLPRDAEVVSSLQGEHGDMETITPDVGTRYDLPIRDVAGGSQPFGEGAGMSLPLRLTTVDINASTVQGNLDEVADAPSVVPDEGLPGSAMVSSLLSAGGGCIRC